MYATQSCLIFAVGTNLEKQCLPFIKLCSVNSVVFIHFEEKFKSFKHGINLFIFMRVS